MSQASSELAGPEQAGIPFPDLQHERWTRDQLERYQARALQRCREHAYAKSRFYQRFHRGLADRPLQELPVLTKSLLLEHFDELATDSGVRLDRVRQYMADPGAPEFYLDRYRVMTTSGSTGHPAIFVYDDAEWSAVMGSLGRVLSWLGPEAHGKPAIIASPNRWHMGAHIQKSNAQRGPGLRISATDPLDAMVGQLNMWQPTAVLAYPSIVRALASEQEKGRLRIAPKAVVCVSEMLLAPTRQRIMDTWHIQPYNLYATTEGGLLGADCEHHQGLHVFEDLVILEVVDHENRPVPPGVPGDRVLLTVLSGRTMPLIRYELTDSVCLSARGACPCGRSFARIDDPRGRVWGDALYLSSAEGAEVVIHPVAIEAVMSMFPVSGWQVRGGQDGLHVVVSGAAADIDEALLRELARALRGHGAAVPQLRLQHVAAIPRGPHGKVKLVESHRNAARQSAE